MLTRQEEKLLHAAAGRHGRRKSGLSLCEGTRCVAELVRRQPTWIKLVVVGESFAATVANAELLRQLESAAPCRRLADAQVAAFASTANPQGVLALFAPVAPPADTAWTGAAAFALVLDRLAEPGNLGTILRTAWAFGLNTVWLTDGGVDPFSPKAIRAGMGAQFALDLRGGGTLEQLRPRLAQLGFPNLWLAVPRGGISSADPAFDLQHAAIVVGNEAAGVTPLADAPHVSIPMPGDAESLNASQAATILLYEALRRGLLG